MIERLKQHPKIKFFKTIGKVADDMSLDAYLVGGFVRDLFLNRDSKDADILVVGSGVEFAKAVHAELGEGSLSYFKNFGTANIKMADQFELEFVGARKESYNRDSRNPVVEDGTLDDDLNRRDLTINTLAYALNSKNFGELVDKFNGLRDIKNTCIKTPLKPDITFSDDPLRMMRAIRFASQLNFKIQAESLKAIKKNKERIEIISQERITDELNKIVLSPRPSIGFEYLYDTGLLKIIFPEMVALQGVDTINDVSHKDNFYHTLKVLDNVAAVSKDLWLRWSAILHDIGKPKSKRFDDKAGWTFHGHEVIGARMVKPIFNKLKLPLGDQMRYVRKMVNLHLRPIALTQEVSDSAIRRLIVDAGDDIEDLFKLCKADITSKNSKKVSRIIKGFESVEQKIEDVCQRDHMRNWKNPITGGDIMTHFNIKPSREVGDLKEYIKEAILNGDVPNEREKALELMKKKGEEMGLKKKEVYE